MMKTYSARPGDAGNDWTLIDGAGLVVGRLASVIAARLRGKHKACYTPHMDCGDTIIVVNAEKVVFTGRKSDLKTYYRHTGYPGGIKSVVAGSLLSGRFPDRVLRLAVKRMLPRGHLGRLQLKKLKIYKGAAHPHMGQQPKVLDVASLHPMNSRKAH